MHTKLVILIFQLILLIAINHNSRTNRFQLSKKHFLYALTVLLIFSIGVPIVSKIWIFEFIFSIEMNSIDKFCIIIIWICQLVRIYMILYRNIFEIRKIISIVNDIVHLIRYSTITNEFMQKNILDLKFLIWFIVETIGIPILFVIVMSNEIQGKSFEFKFITFAILLSVLVGQQATIPFYFFVKLFSNLLRNINSQLHYEMMLLRRSCASKYKTIHANQKIEQIFLIYSEIGQLVERLTNFYRVIIVINISTSCFYFIWNFFIIISTFFDVENINDETLNNALIVFATIEGFLKIVYVVETFMEHSYETEQLIAIINCFLCEEKKVFITSN